ncbi:MAG: type 4a pilus biogenesis protein PilO [Sedimentisphaerales bacterium]|nr:type 4a pilus biogenesis protein PilO [Sedimentisphaerales bacterium]
MKIGFRELLFVLLLVAIPLGAYWWIFKPANERMEVQRCEIEAKAQKLASLQKALVGIKDLNEEVGKLQEAVLFFKAKLPKHHEIHRVLEQVTKIAESHRLDTKMFRTLKPTAGAAYSEQPIEMEVGGDFNAFYQFLLDIEKLPRITKVRQLTLEKDKENEGTTKAELALSIYFDRDPDNGGPGRS